MLKSRKAFTIVEIMIIVIVIIIGLLAAMTIPAFQKVKANEERRKAGTATVQRVTGTNANDGRFVVEDVGVVTGNNGYGYVITDKTTGKQFLAIYGVGVADLNITSIKMSTPETEGRFRR